MSSWISNFHNYFFHEKYCKVSFFVCEKKHSFINILDLNKKILPSYKIKQEKNCEKIVDS